MPEPTTLQRDLELLAADLKRLEGEYNMFFSGRLPRPPWETRGRVQAIIKRYDRGHSMGTGDRFRFQTLQSRWAAFSELWERQLKAQETGRRPGRSRTVSPPPRISSPPPSPLEPAAPLPPGDGVVATARISDPAGQAERIKELYQQMTAAKQAVGEKAVDFDRFTAVVQAQVRKLGEGGRKVAFQVAMKDGKVTLTASSED